jgi:hypothetical protein
MIFSIGIQKGAGITTIILPDNELDNSILVEAKLAQAYSSLRNYGFIFPAFGMQNYTTPDVEKGSTPSDGQQVVQFKPYELHCQQ